MIIERIDFRTAETFFKSYEHLGNCGLGVWHWGATENNRLVGVVSFGTTSFAQSRGLLSIVAKEFGLGIYQICRGGTIHTAPLNTPSRILSCAMRELRRERGDCLIVAYSDRRYKEVGTIYQACNGVYTGETEPCLSSIILSPRNGNVKMSPHETGDIHVESEGTAASERNQRMH